MEAVGLGRQPLSVPTAHDNLLPNQGWRVCSLPTGCTLRSKDKGRGEVTAKVLTQEGKKEKSLASSTVSNFPFSL